MPSPQRGRQLALVAALLGWMFDGLEMGLFPLVARPALRELFGPGVSESVVGNWFSVITAGFLVGAATGGVLFGWLGDKLGRVKAMTLSVIVYAGSSGACAFAGEPWHVAVLRFIGALGMGGEWALGVALVMEIWPNASRGMLAGLIGAFGNLGYFLVGLIALGLNRLGGDLDVGSLTSKGNWRLLMLIGALPAVLTLFIRLFVPESSKWEQEKAAGKASHWSGVDLFGVLIGAAAASGIIYLWAVEHPLEIRLIGTVGGLVIVTLGYLYPVRKYVQRAGMTPAARRQTMLRMMLAAGLSAVPLLGTWAGLMWMYNWVDQLSGGKEPDARPVCMVSSALGAVIGCYIGAILAERFGRRLLYACLCIISLIVMVGFFQLNTGYNLTFILSAGLLGMTTAAFYGWLPLYLPELFPTSVRASGQGFGFNFGRILAAVGALQIGNILKYFDNNYGQACSLVAVVYIAGLVIIFFAPETRGKPLPE